MLRFGRGRGGGGGGLGSISPVDPINSICAKRLKSNHSKERLRSEGSKKPFFYIQNTDPNPKGPKRP